MHIFLFSDIFGVNQSLLRLQQKLKENFDKVSILDPYQGTQFNFHSEQQAYAEFIKTSGHEQYFQNSRELLSKNPEVKCLLGFSAGASVCWRLSELITPTNIQQIVAFYPSQIRHYLHLDPAVNTTVVFPKMETLFSVEESMVKLQKKKKVDCYHSQFLHGFMNPASSGYSEEADDSYSSAFAQEGFFINPLSVIKTSICN